jgi:hypothetical protein
MDTQNDGQHTKVEGRRRHERASRPAGGDGGTWRLIVVSVVVAVGGAEAAAPEAAALAVREALRPADVGAVGAAHAGAPEPVALRLARPRLRHHHRASQLLCNPHQHTDATPVRSQVFRTKSMSQLGTTCCLATRCTYRWPRAAARRGGRPRRACVKPPWS